MVSDALWDVAHVLMESMSSNTSFHSLIAACTLSYIRTQLYHSSVVSVARRFEKEFGIVRTSLGDAIRIVIANQPKTALAQKIQQLLQSGQTLTDDLSVAALQVALMDMNCATRG